MRLNLLMKVAVSYCKLNCMPAFFQDMECGINKPLCFPSAFFNSVDKKTAHLEDQLAKQTEPYLQRLVKFEKKLQLNLSKIDSAGAQQQFADSRRQYLQHTNKIKGKADKMNGARCGEYLPGTQGMGLCSFLDMKIKGSFYGSGGFEYNYQPGVPPATDNGGPGMKPLTL